jgi:hypothetical protein
MPSPHPGMHVLCPACEGPVPDLLGELTDEPAAVNAGQRAADCYYCGVPLVCTGPDDLQIGPTAPPPARRTARKRDLKFGDASGVDAWVAGVEKALADEARNPHRDPRLPPITKTRMVNRYGQRAFEGYPWYDPPPAQSANP